MCTLATSKSGGYHHGDLRNALLKTATAIVAEGGADKASIREIASRAEVSATALYRHFPDKEALLVAVAEQGLKELKNTLKKADAAAHYGEALKAQAVAYVTFAQKQPSLFRLMFGPITSTSPRAAQKDGDTAYDVLACRVAADMASEKTESFTVGCWALVHGLATLVIDDRIPGLGQENIAAMTERIIAAMLSQKSVVKV